MIYWIEKYVRNTSSNILQIGSNDGVTGDSIYHLALIKTNWKVVLVKPAPYHLK